MCNIYHGAWWSFWSYNLHKGEKEAFVNDSLLQEQSFMLCPVVSEQLERNIPAL